MPDVKKLHGEPYGLCDLLDQVWAYWDENCNGRPVKITIEGQAEHGYDATIEHDPTPDPEE